MFQRQKTGSVLCPSCGSLVGVNDETCLSCGRRRPGLFGFASLLRKTGDDMGFLGIVLFACGAMFISSLLASTEVNMENLLTLFSPDGYALLRMGGSGAYPIYRLDRWWTVLSYGWLHGGIMHIVFNMMSARSLIPALAELYGPARTVIIYTAGTIGAAVVSSFIGAYGRPYLPEFLQGAQLVVGASGAIFGLLGALAYYGRRGGSRGIDQMAWGWILSGLAFGFLLPHVDNWAHLGGLASGYVVARWLDPLHPERGDHVIVAALCLAASLAAIVASLLVPLPFARPD
jgi:membrane associated rhomboid family serine protease